MTCKCVQGDFKSQKEAVWAITNLTSGGTVEQIAFAVQCGALKPLCDLLVTKDIKVTLVILDAINNVLMVSDPLNTVQMLQLLHACQNRM